MIKSAAVAQPVERFLHQESVWSASMMNPTLANYLRSALEPGT